jgi:hypothetical protein
MRSAQAPKLQFLPQYDASRLGLGAKSWLTDLEQSCVLYNLFDQQMVLLARLLCVGNGTIKLG